MRASLPPAADGVLPLLCELVVLTQLQSSLAADASAFSLVAASFVTEPLSQSFSPSSQSFSPLSGESEALFSEVFRLLSFSPPLSSAREILFSSALSFSLSFSFRGAGGDFLFLSFVHKPSQKCLYMGVLMLSYSRFRSLQRPPRCPPHRHQPACRWG